MSNRETPLTRALGIGPPQEIEIDLIDIHKATDGSYQYNADNDDEGDRESNIVEVEPTDDSDTAFATAVIKTMINHAKDAVKDLSSLAKQTDSPRAYEVLSTVIKTAVDAAKDVAAIEEKKMKAKGGPGTGEATNVTNNNLFVGTSHDLAKLLKDMREGKES